MTAYDPLQSQTRIRAISPIVTESEMNLHQQEICRLVTENFAYGTELSFCPIS
jgi:hypothetical protein